MTKKEKSRLETGSTRKNTPNHQHIKNYSTFSKKSSLRLLPGERIGLCLADDNLSAHQDSIQGRGWSLALQAILQPFLLIYSQLPWENKKRKFGYLAVALKIGERKEVR